MRMLYPQSYEYKCLLGSRAARGHDATMEAKQTSGMLLKRLPSCTDTTLLQARPIRLNEALSVSTALDSGPLATVTQESIC